MSKRTATGGVRPKSVEDGVIPESRIFADPNADQDPLRGLRGYHVQGVPIEEWAEGMPAEIVARMSYPLTDEGQAEQAKLARRDDRRLPSGRIATEPDDKQILEYGDFVANEENDSWEAPDARKDLAKQYVKPGMRARFVNPAKLSKTGRDARGWEVVKDEKGDPVTQGTSVLAQMPERKAEARNKHYRDQGNALLEQVYARADNKLRTSPEDLLNSAPPRR